MANTPLGRYSFAETDLVEGWHRDPGPEDVWAKQEIEIMRSVQNYADLPAPDPTMQTAEGQRRIYYVRNNSTAYRDDGAKWVPVWGLGSAGDPIPGRAFREALEVVNGMTVDGGAVIDTNNNTTPLSIRRQRNSNEAIEIGIGDSIAHHTYTNDEAQATIRWVANATDTETGAGANANTSTLQFLTSPAEKSLRLNGNEIYHQGNLDLADIGGASAADLTAHTSNTNNPHGVTATQAGALPTTGGSVTGDVSVSGTVTAGNVNAPLDGLRRQDFALNTRTFDLSAGSAGAWWKIARISENSGNRDSRFNVTVDGTGPFGTNPHQVKKALFAARGAQRWMDVSVEGNLDVQNRADIVTTINPTDGHRYLYIRANGFLSATLTVQHTGRFGQFEFQQVATDAADTTGLIGTIETDSGTDTPSYDLNVGEIRSNGPIKDQGNQVWHEGNLSPATDAELAAHATNTTNPHAVTAAQVDAPTTADFTGHTSNTTNPHAVTAAQVGAPTTADLTAHTSNTTNPHSVTASQAGALPTAGGTMTGPIKPPDDSLSNLINVSSTSAIAGTEVGYTFNLDDRIAVAVKGQSDGAGGLTGVSFEFHSENGQVAELDNAGNLRIAGTLEQNALF